VDAAALISRGLVPDERWPVKILGNGTLARRLTIVAGAYSKSAHEQITKAGGAAQNLNGQPYEFRKPKRRFPTTGGGAGGAKATGKGGKSARSKAPPADAAEDQPAPSAPEAAG
jgi:hypothetical protein